MQKSRILFIYKIQAAFQAGRNFAIAMFTPSLKLTVKPVTAAGIQLLTAGGGAHEGWKALKENISWMAHEFRAGYLEMGSCPLNSTELWSGCCNHWSTAGNPDCSSGCRAAGLLSERVPAPRRAPFPHPAGCTQKGDSLHTGLVSLHQFLGVLSPKQSLSPSQSKRTVSNPSLGLKNRHLFGCHCPANANSPTAYSFTSTQLPLPASPPHQSHLLDKYLPR